MQTNIDKELIEINQKIKNKMLQHLPYPDHVNTAIPSLSMSRRHIAFEFENCFYKPLIGIIVQGAKHSVIGAQEYQYGEYSLMACGVDMPSITQLTDASPEKPFLAISIGLDRYLLTQLLTELALPNIQSNSNETEPQAIIVDNVTKELLNAFLRLIELLDSPEHIAVLAPMIIREIHYLVLVGSQGEKLRQISAIGSQSNRIAQAIGWLRDNFNQPIQVDDLAQKVNMAPSSFHRNFRRITSLSPLQFQKRLRLYEAERLMLVEGKDTLNAAFAVGYESVTQFNREYKRQFGEPPFRDINNKRANGIMPTKTQL